MRHQGCHDKFASLLLLEAVNKNPVFPLLFLFRTRQKDEELSPGLLFFRALCGSESLVFKGSATTDDGSFTFYVRLHVGGG